MAKNYKPEFSFKEGRIYDGERQIARIDPRRTFTSVVLRPGGKEVLEWIYMRSEKPGSFSLSEESTPQRLVLTGDLDQRPDVAAKVEMALTYDEKLKSYVYDISWERRLKKRPASSWKNAPDFRDPELPRHNWYGAALEYCNIGPAGRGQCRWGYCLYQARSGEWLKVPLNHYLTLQMVHIDFKKGGALLGFFGEDTPYVNPVIELVGETADNTLLGICDAGYDYHLKIKPSPGRRRYRARFRVYCLGRDEGRALLGKAKFRYTEAEMKDWQRPVMRFKKGSHFIADFEQPNRQTSPVSVGIWRPWGDISKTRWLKQGGYKSKGCIEIGQKDTHVKCHWSRGCNCSSWQMAEPGQTYRISAYIKTENLRGKGAYLAADIPLVMPNKAGLNFVRSTKRVFSRRLTGTNDWTEVELEVSDINNGLVDIRLCHEGRGVSYFDNVTVEGNVMRVEEVLWDFRHDKRFRIMDRKLEANSRGTPD